MTENKEFRITLLSSRKIYLFIALSILASFILIFLTIIFFKEPLPIIIFNILVIITLPWIYDRFARFNTYVIINNQFIKVEDRFTITWDSVKSYTINNRSLTLITDNKKYNFIGLKSGIQSEKFVEMSNAILNIINSKNKTSDTSKILQYDIYNNKFFRITSYVLILISIAAILYVAILLMMGHKFKGSNIYLKLFVSILATISMIIRMRISSSDFNKKASG